MTHAEATCRDTARFRSPCPGELRHLGTYPDRQHAGGAIHERNIHLYACECGQRLSVTADGVVLNVYDPPPPRVVSDRTED